MNKLLSTNHENLVKYLQILLKKNMETTPVVVKRCKKLDLSLKVIQHPTPPKYTQTCKPKLKKNMWGTFTLVVIKYVYQVSMQSVKNSASSLLQTF